MPALGRLAREGAAFEVEPCRDQLTYLCIRAALTGHDDSSLLAVSANFQPDREGPPDSLLSLAAESSLRTAVIGSADFHPYRRWLHSEVHLEKTEETPERVASQFRNAWNSDAQLVIVALASGDMVAHAHGTRSPQYRNAFRRIDDTLGMIGEIAGNDVNLLVFGDHGHDTAGRHLPGTEAKTWAVYRGPAFRPGISGRLRITDHRSLLGILLGLATEPTYRGPALSSIFDTAWVTRSLAHGLPPLQAKATSSAAPSGLRWLVAATIALCTWLAALVLGAPKYRWRIAGIGGITVALAAVVGSSYDSIRNLVHDHGDSPERALCLLVPVALGLLVASPVRRAFWPNSAAERPRWWHVAVVATLFLTFTLLLPTAYYYGARRAVILASALGLVPLCFHSPRKSWGQAVNVWLSMAFVACVLLTLYSVRQLGPETGGASTWALDAPLYTQATWLALIAAKLVMYRILVAPRAGTHPTDSAITAGLLATSLLVELAGARLPREAYAVVLVALVVGAIIGRPRLLTSLFAGALLLLDHLYGNNGAHLAPLQMLLASTCVLLACRSDGENALRRSWLPGIVVTVAIYLLFWPTVGFHLAGLDFAFMFQWIPEANYDTAWQWIALGTAVKIGLPIVVVIALAHDHLRERLTRNVVAAALGAKVALLSVMIAFYAVSHSMESQQALAMLAELVLVLFGASVSILAMPSVRRSAEPVTRPLAAHTLREPRSRGYNPLASLEL